MINEVKRMSSNYTVSILKIIILHRWIFIKTIKMKTKEKHSMATGMLFVLVNTTEE